MNEFLRLLQKSLRPFGYDVRRRKTLNLLPFCGISPLPALDRVRRDFDHDGGDASKTNSNLDVLKIVYRICLTQQRCEKTYEGVASKSLMDTVEHCFISLLNSVNAALQKKDPPHIELIILDDHSDVVYLDRIKNLAAQSKCAWRVQTTKETGQGGSLHEQFSLARHDNALYYFL